MPDSVERDSGSTNPDHERHEVRHADGRIEHPRVRFEQTDARFIWILAVILAACGVLGLEYYLVWGFFQNREAAQAELKQSPYPLAPHPSQTPPVEPRLEQIDRLAGIETPNVLMRDLAKEQLLHRYGLTAQKEFVHVPIERAMEAVLRELPVREQPEKPIGKDNGLVGSGASNSGRMFRGAPQW